MMDEARRKELEVILGAAREILRLQSALSALNAEVKG